jgi:hypothetical protein
MTLSLHDSCIMGWSSMCQMPVPPFQVLNLLGIGWGAAFTSYPCLHDLVRIFVLLMVKTVQVFS